ncbi:MAG TPA: helix-turn-helix transcriptional regulator [Clostridiales bacterium]|nr:helix-turn-helix transcriptional regulator [Clostridiales bacterium]
MRVASIYTLLDLFKTNPNWNEGILVKNRDGSLRTNWYVASADAWIHTFCNLLELDTIFDIQTWITNILIGVAAYNCQKNNSRIQRIVEQIKDVVNKRFAEDLSVSSVVSEVFLLAGYATSLFKKETGISIMNFIIKVRIDAAKKMLQDPSSRVSEVSYRVGYENIAYFSTLFKNIVGKTPKEYRDSYPDLSLENIEVIMKIMYHNNKYKNANR